MSYIAPEPPKGNKKTGRPADKVNGTARPLSPDGSQTGIARPAADTNTLMHDYLAERGLTPDQASGAGIFPVDSAAEVHASFEARQAIVIPYFDPTGAPVIYTAHGQQMPFCRVRYLGKPRSGFVDPAKQKKRRFSQPSGSPVVAYFAQGTAIDWSAVLANTAVSLVLTEGEVKALCTCGRGIPCVALGGVDSFTKEDAKGEKLFLPELEAVAWQGRHVYVAFDSDAITNDSVQRAERRLTAELVRRGAIVHVVRIPAAADGSKQGLDDFLCAHGADALLKLLEGTPPADPTKSLVLEGTDVEIADSVLLDFADKHDSSVVFCEGAFHVYSGTHWRPLPEHEVANAIYRYDKIRFRPGAAGIVKLNKSRTASVLAIMQDRATAPEFFADAPAGINCRSGFVRFDADGEPSLEPHDRDHRQRHCLPGSWQPGATRKDAPLLRKLLEGCFGAGDDSADKMALVAEICGVAALGHGTKLLAPKAVVLHGQHANNGKSQVLDMLHGLLPKDACSAVSPAQFGKASSLAELVGRKLNACAELGTAHAIAADVFKSVVTGDRIEARQLYKPPVFFRPAVLNVFATNALPAFIGGMDRGVQRRLLVLEFVRSIPHDEQVADIGKRIAAEEADALLAFALEGAARVIKAGRFTEPESSRVALRKWVSEADPVIAWLENCAECAEGERLPTKAVFADFVRWAEVEGFRSDRLPSVNNFVQRLLAQDQRLANARDKQARYIVGLRLKTDSQGWPGNVVAMSQREAIRAKIDGSGGMGALPARGG